MSEPITLTEQERAVFARVIAHLMGEAHNRETSYAWQIGEVLRAWLRDMAPPAESASPSRVPGASAHPSKVGVESGPGQPTDIVERLERIRSMIGKMCREGRPPAMTVPADPTRDEDLFIADAADEAAAEIRRLRAEGDALKDELQIQTDRHVQREVARTKQGFRAGIEAAAKLEDTIAKQWLALPDQRSTLTYHELALSAQDRAKRIRALADKPAPDAARKGG